MLPRVQYAAHTLRSLASMFMENGQFDKTSVDPPTQLAVLQEMKALQSDIKPVGLIGPTDDGAQIGLRVLCGMSDGP